MITAQVATAYENPGFTTNFSAGPGTAAEITERKQAQESLRQTLRARAVMAECNHALIHAREEHELFDQMCQTMVEAFTRWPDRCGPRRGTQTLVLVAHAGCSRLPRNGDTPKWKPTAATRPWERRSVAAIQSSYPTWRR